MKIDVKNGNEARNKGMQEMKLNSELILKYLIGNDDKSDTLIMCKSSEISLVTTDQALYEALGSIKQYDDFKLNKLVKLLEVVKVQSIGGKSILKEEKVEELRKKALNKV